jgi:DNA-binding NarL/FixJ family response regulator
VALDLAVAACRAALGAAAFDRAWTAGRTLAPSQAVATALAQAVTPASSSGVTLTRREAEILRLLSSGMTDPAIAAVLFISVRTVEQHVARLLRKLGVRTRTAALASAIAIGLVAPPGVPPDQC